MTTNPRWSPPPPPVRQAPPPRTGMNPVAIVAICMVAVFWVLALGLWLPAFSQWHNRNCTVTGSAYLAVTRGKPGVLDYCISQK